MAMRQDNWGQIIGVRSQLFDPKIIGVRSQLFLVDQTNHIRLANMVGRQADLN